MNYLKFLSEVTTVPGTSGYETPVAEVLAKAFAPYCDEVKVDHTQSVIAHRCGSGKGPKIMLCAHIDEVGLMTMNVEEDGSVGFISLGFTVLFGITCALGRFVLKIPYVSERQSV